MKILHAHIITGIAGSESYLLKTLPAIKAAGIEVEFLCIYRQGHKIDTNSFTEKIDNQGIKVHFLPIGWLSYLFAIQRLHCIITRGNYDLIHTHLIHADVILAGYKKLINAKIKLVSTKHGYEEAYTVGPKLKAKVLPTNLYYRLAVFAEKQMIKSYAISASLKELYVWLQISKSNRIEVINYGFDFPTSIQSEGLLPKSKTNLVIVGRLEETKGHVYALRALRKIVNQNSNILLTIVGIGSFEKEIRKEIDRLELADYVDLKGYMPNGIEFMHAADIILVPSIREGFGIVVLEAFSQKKPILVFDVPAVNEIVVNEFSGFVIPAFSVDKFAAKLELLINFPELREEQGINGFNTWQKLYSMERMLGNTLSFYHSIAHNDLGLKKVAIFTISLFGGGTEKICQLLSEELSKKAETHLILLSKNQKLKIPSRANVHFLTNEEKMSYFIKFLLIPLLAWRLYRYLKKNDIKVLMSMLNRPNYISVFTKAFFFPNLRLLISERTYSGHEYGGFTIINLVSKMFIKWLYPKSDSVIVNSKTVGNHLVEDFGIDNGKIKVIHNGVELSNRKVAEYGNLKLLMVGRLDKNKNHRFVLEAIKENKDIEAVSIVGEGAEFNNLKSYVDKNNLNSKVSLKGFILEPFASFEEYNLFVLPSIHEGFPNVLLEALSVGCMVISSDCFSGPREILSPNSDPNKLLSSGFEVTEFGILYAVNDQKALIDAIDFVVSQPALVVEMRKKAKIRASHFSQSEMTENYEKLLIS